MQNICQFFLQNIPVYDQVVDICSTSTNVPSNDTGSGEHLATLVQNGCT